jgi:hypothetical protein
MRLVAAHIELGKAEFGAIMDEVKKVAALVGLAIAVLILVGFLVPIGLALFLGDWLFGSMGWGILHGTLLLMGIAVAALLGALGTGGGTILRDLVVAVVIGVVVGVALALDLTNQLWATIGRELAPGIDEGVRPLVVGATALALLGAFLGLIIGARGGTSGAIAGLVGGAILGALLGAFSAITFGIQVGAAMGVTVALIAWLALMGAGAARRGIDTDALKARFYPDETIDMTKETIEWVRAQTPLGPKS